MEETTTTNAPVDAGEVQTIQGIAIDDQGQAISQPEDTDQAQAAVETTETENTQEATSEPSEDEQLTKFATAKGVTLDSDSAKKLAKMAMNAEKAMHSKATRASELERTMSTMGDDAAQRQAQATGENPEVLKRLMSMEVKSSIRDFWDANPDAQQYESEMARIATEAGLYGTPEAILKASYAIAAMNNQGAVKSQGKREALESLAHKQQAAVPTGNAVNSSMTSNTITPQNVEQMVARNSQEWFVTNYDAINKAMRG
jgi:hypothetical protein